MQRRETEAVIVIIQSVKMIVMIMNITLKGDCDLTSVLRSKVKNPGNDKREDVVDGENENTSKWDGGNNEKSNNDKNSQNILTWGMVSIMMIFMRRILTSFFSYVGVQTNKNIVCIIFTNIHVFPDFDDHVGKGKIIRRNTLPPHPFYQKVP